MCSVSDEAKYCKATSATREAQSSQEWKQPKLYHIQIWTLVAFKIIRLFCLHSRLGLQRTNLLKNSQDNDKLPPDLNAAPEHHPCRQEQSEKFYSVPHTSPWIFTSSLIKACHNMQARYKKRLYIINTAGWKITNCSSHYSHPPHTQWRTGAYRWEIRTFCSEPQLL